MPVSDEKAEEIIRDFGLIRLSEGEHLHAWQAFWGVDLHE